jgi:hypothetical protein
MEDLRLGIIRHTRPGNARNPSALSLSIRASVRTYPTNHKLLT